MQQHCVTPWGWQMTWYQSCGGQPVKAAQKLEGGGDKSGEVLKRCKLWHTKRLHS